jgi:hypothetical protein
MALLAGDTELRLVSDNPMLPVCTSSVGVDLRTSQRRSLTDACSLTPGAARCGRGAKLAGSAVRSLYSMHAAFGSTLNVATITLITGRQLSSQNQKRSRPRWSLKKWRREDLPTTIVTL